MEKEELKPIYDRRKSFYKKAFIVRNADNSIDLLSYATIVATIKDGKLHINGFYSNTTLRHIKEFVEQMGFQSGSKAELEKMYY